MEPGASSAEEAASTDESPRDLEDRSASGRPSRAGRAKQPRASPESDDAPTGLTKSEKQQLARMLTKEDITALFGQSLEDAARAVGLGRTSFKQVCRREGIEGWPQVAPPPAAAAAAAAAPASSNHPPRVKVPDDRSRLPSMSPPAERAASAEPSSLAYSSSSDAPAADKHISPRRRKRCVSIRAF